MLHIRWFARTCLRETFHTSKKLRHFKTQIRRSEANKSWNVDTVPETFESPIWSLMIPWKQQWFCSLTHRPALRPWNIKIPKDVPHLNSLRCALQIVSVWSRKGPSIFNLGLTYCFWTGSQWFWSGTHDLFTRWVQGLTITTCIFN